jgi:uncharacterized protein (DUF362 family)
MSMTTRRHFLRGLSALAAAGCASAVQSAAPVPAGVPLPTPGFRYRLTRDWGPRPTRVIPEVRPAVVGTAHAPDPQALDPARLVREAVEQAGGLERAVRPGDRVVIKLNLVSAMPSGTGFTTDARVAEAVARLVLDAGARQVIFAEGSASAPGPPVSGYRPEATQLAFERCGIRDLARRLDAGLLDLNDAGHEAGGRTLVREVHLPHGLQRKTYWFSKAFLDADRVISVPVLKNHEYTGVTMALKNWIGVAPAGIYHPPGARTGKWGLDHQMIPLARHIVDLVTARPPDYVVMDALVGINSGVRAYPFRPGPGGPMRAVLAGPDPVALDAIGCLAMTYDPATIGHLVFAEGVGLGVADPARIAVRGAGIEPFRQEYSTPVNGMYVPGRWRKGS